MNEYFARLSRKHKKSFRPVTSTVISLAILFVYAPASNVNTNVK